MNNETINKLTVFLTCLSVSLCIALGITTHWLQEAGATMDEAIAWCRKVKIKFGELTE